VASTENESDTHQTPPMSTRRSPSSAQAETSIPTSARRKLRLMDTEKGGWEEKKGDNDTARVKLPQAIVVEDEDFVSIEREGVSDFAESEVEGVARRYLMQTLNRTLVELFHACDADGNIDRCDHALSILQEATRSFQVLRDRMAQGSCLSSEMAADGACSAAMEFSSVRKLHKHLENDEDSMDSPGAAMIYGSAGRGQFLAGTDGNGDAGYNAADSAQKMPQRVQTWCDIVRRHDGVLPANSKEGVLGQRSLHEKLLSPDRHRKNPEDVQRKQEEKQELAKRKREELESQRQEKLREAEVLRQEKLRQIKEKRETEKISMDERLKRAHDLYQARLLERQLKAGKETTKVHEVKQEIAFIDLLTAENKTMALQTRLELAEGRRLHMLELAAKVSERTAREVSARQRRAAIEGAKIERLQARQAQKFGTAGDFSVADSSDTIETPRQQSSRDDARDRTTVAREEAARLRRAQLEEERQRKVEVAAQEKEQRAEEHQRKLLEERMKVLAAKEARLRHQAQHLERMTQAMQADALAQRESLEQRLQCVLDRKQRYMAQIVAKAQGDKISHIGSEGSMEQSLSLPEKESIEEIEEKTSKGQRKRAKKFKQRLAGIRNAWQEKEEDSQSGARASAAGSRLSKLSRLFSDVIKGAPAGEELEKMSIGNKGNCPLHQPCRDLDGMVRALQEIHRFVKQEESDSRLASNEERELLYSSIRKSGCVAALIRLVSADEKLTYQRLLSAVLKVLVDVCTAHETNRLYIVATGRLIPLIDALDTAICSLSFADTEGYNVLMQLMVIVSICFRAAAETSIQAQARDDTLGYLVNCGILLKTERLIISVIRLVAGSSVSKSVDPCEAKNQRCTVHLKILEAAVTLLESITLCYESNGQIKSAVRDSAVLANLVAALDEGQLVGLVPLLSTLFLDAKMCTSSAVNVDLLKERGACPSTVKIAPGVFCAVKALRALNNIAILDLALVQRTLGSVVVCSEFSHVALEILESCKSNAALNSGLAAQGGSIAPPSEMLHELILLLGYLAFSSSPIVQSPFAGWRNGVKMLQQLCALPISYFISPPLREVLLPTLVVATYKNPALLDAMRDQVCASLLATYLDHYYKCMQNRGLDPGGLPNEGMSKQWARLPPSLVPSRFHLENRFPRGNWVEAAEWFKSWKYEDDNTLVSIEEAEAT
jgi:hypothetical protein